MRAYGSRNPYSLAAVSILVIGGLLALAYNVDRLPVVGAGPRYRAEFSEAAGLAVGTEVRIAGVKVGKVTGVSLRGDHVEVAFQVKAEVGDQSTASIQIKTLLGTKFLAVDPAGDKPLPTDTPIPLEHTVTPYDVVQAFNQLSDTVRDLDTQRLAASLRALSDTFIDTPTEVRASLDGLSRLSVTIASRDDQLAHLLDNTNKATQLLAKRNDDINAILADATKLLDELRARESAISQLLDGTHRLSEQLHGLIQDNQDQLGPSLNALDQLTETLRRHHDDLAAAIRRLGPFDAVFANVLGNGRWFDGFLDGLVPATPLQPDSPATLTTPPPNAAPGH